MVIFLDRDGTLNRDPGKAYYVRTPAQFRWIPGVFTALRGLSDAGAKLVIVSNQAGVGRRLVTPEQLDTVTQKIFSDLNKNKIRLSGIFYCVHAPEEGCDCRKPADGLFRAADKALKLGHSARFLIGDTERDLAAGNAAGCRTVLVLSGKTRRSSDIRFFKCKPDYIAANLKEAAQWVLRQKKS